MTRDISLMAFAGMALVMLLTGIGIPILAALNAGLPGVHSPASLPAEGLDLKDYLGNLEQGLIQQALDDAAGVVARAAERLRIRRTTLVEKMRKYGMNRRDDDEQSDD